MGTYRIVLADDHALFLQGLKQVLQEVSDLEVIGEAVDGRELLDLLTKVTPDMVILDISMPNLRGIEAIEEIKTLHPEAKILMLTMHSDKEYLYQAVAAGADGYFLKKDAHTELFSAIEKVRRGKIYVSPSLSEDMAADWEQIRRGFRKPILTPREIEVLKLIAEGKSNKMIGDQLFISTHTVERHRANIMEKLNFKKTADLVKYAIQKGYI
jgi:DNA-binding NarL/FixJ family response regulator